MVSSDKDLRYMALSDLLNEMNKDAFKFDNLEPKVSVSRVSNQSVHHQACMRVSVGVRWCAQAPR